MSEQAERDIETVRKWLDGGCGSWGLPSNAIRRILDRVSLPASAEGGEATDGERMRTALSAFADAANWSVNGRFDPNSGNFDGVSYALAALTPRGSR